MYLMVEFEKIFPIDSEQKGKHFGIKSIKYPTINSIKLHSPKLKRLDEFSRRRLM
jgi:hypothetical protein